MAIDKIIIRLPWQSNRKFSRKDVSLECCLCFIIVCNVSHTNRNENGKKDTHTHCVCVCVHRQKREMETHRSAALKKCGLVTNWCFGYKIHLAFHYAHNFGHFQCSHLDNWDINLSMENIFGRNAKANGNK